MSSLCRNPMVVCPRRGPQSQPHLDGKMPSGLSTGQALLSFLWNAVYLTPTRAYTHVHKCTCTPVEISPHLYKSVDDTWQRLVQCLKGSGREGPGWRREASRSGPGSGAWEARVVCEQWGMFFWCCVFATLTLECEASLCILVHSHHWKEAAASETFWISTHSSQHTNGSLVEFCSCVHV